MKSIKMFLLMPILGIAISMSSTSLVQGRPISQAGCALIDSSRPSLFISYDSTGGNLSEIILRLHNNMNCSIIVETDDRNPTRITRLPNNGIRVELVTTPQEGVRLPLHYFVQDRRGRQWPAYGWGDSVFTYEILSGQSAIFNVPLIHFRKRLDIVVPFNYKWERDKPIAMSRGGVRHRVHFLSEDIPEVILRKRR